MDLNGGTSKTTEREKRRQNRNVYYFFNDSLKRVKAIARGQCRKELSVIRSLSKGGNFLDVGCANGRILRRLGSQRASSLGHRNLQAACNRIRCLYCAARGGRVITATAMSGISQFPDHFFDIILMRSYLEHEIEPFHVLRDAKRALKTSGYLVIKVPNFNCLNRWIRGRSWPGFRYPDHVNYFVPDSLKRLVENAGLAIRQFRFCDRLPTSDNMWMVAN